MAYPIDPRQGFLRTPARYPHDAFAVDTGGRVRPHSGIDSTPTVANARAKSVLGGTVVKADWTIYAGNYVVEDAPDGWLWLNIHLASRLVRAGAVLRPGDDIGVVGNTGGGGALGTKSMGIHVHTSRCKDMAAVNRIVNGKVRARYKGESSEAWAANHGLSDPYPHIVASVDGDKASLPLPPTAPPSEEDDMYTEQDRARDNATWEWLRDVQPKVAEIHAIAKRLEHASDVHTWALTDDYAGLRRAVANVHNAIATLPGSTAQPVDAAQIAAELGKRLSNG